MTGTVYDAMTGQPLPAATVGVVNNAGNYTGAGIVADGNGRYSLNVSNGTRVKVSSIGYESVFTHAQPHKDVFLFEKDNQLPPVVVTAPYPDNHYPPYNNNTMPPTSNNNGPTWSELKPMLIGVAVIFAVSIAITEMNDSSKTKAKKKKS